MTSTQEHGLGRLPAPDPRDLRFMLYETPAAESIIGRRNQLWPYFDKPMDQGATGSCVGHGWKAWLATAPIIQSDIDEDPSPFALYDACTQVDEWADNDQDTDRQYGTSVRAGARVLRNLGYITSYRWAFELITCIDWLAGIDHQGRFIGGPVVIGVNWYYDMFDPDAEGFLTVAPNSRVAGGHCVCLTGWNEKRGFAYGLNSWGAGWGKKGRFYLPGELLDRLIHEDGEVCTAAEVRLL